MSQESKIERKEANTYTQTAQKDLKKYIKPLATLAVILVAIIAGWLAYQNWVVKPKESKAQSAIAVAQQYFAADSFRLALNGDGANKGFLAIIKSYGGSKTGNLAHYYAGICYLQTGDFNNAVKQLGAFSTESKPIQMEALGALGDAYSELKQNDKAIDSYKKASATFEEDEATASEYLFRAALLSEVAGKSKEAVELYKSLKEKFPNTARGAQADKYIYRLSIEPNDLSVK
ncbi:MAG: tetratricopeptide repeat protein [Chitinophagaceae bacterium]